MNIFESIAAVMKEIGAVGKNSKNQTQGFMFRGIDAVMNAINPALVKYKVFIVPEILEQTREERTTAKGGLLIYSICKIKYTFYAEDGSFVSAIVIGEGMDSGDKATNKAMSIAFKYACFQVFCIPTEEMKDPDSECHEPISKEEQKANKEISDIKKMKISDIKVKALSDALVAHNVMADTIYKLYKVESLKELTEEQYANINAHWKEIEAKA